MVVGPRGHPRTSQRSHARQRYGPDGHRACPTTSPTRPPSTRLRGLCSRPGVGRWGRRPGHPSQHAPPTMSGPGRTPASRPPGAMHPKGLPPRCAMSVPTHASRHAPGGRTSAARPAARPSALPPSTSPAVAARPAPARRASEACRACRRAGGPPRCGCWPPPTRPSGPPPSPWCAPSATRAPGEVDGRDPLPVVAAWPPVVPEWPATKCVAAPSGARSPPCRSPRQPPRSPPCCWPRRSPGALAAPSFEELPARGGQPGGSRAKTARDPPGWTVV